MSNVQAYPKLQPRDPMTNAAPAAENCERLRQQFNARLKEDSEHAKQEETKHKQEPAISPSSTGIRHSI